MSSPDTTREYDENNGREPDLKAMAEAHAEAHLAEVEEDAAEHWNKIMEIVETLKMQVADLQDMLKDFNKSAIF